MMNRVLIASLRLIVVAAAPAWGSCHGSAECSAPPDLNDVNEEVSLLQAHRSLAKRMALTTTAQSGPGCPNAFTMRILQDAASAAFNKYIGKTFDADLKLEQIACNNAVCAKKVGWTCAGYEPLNATVAVSASSMSFEAYANGDASWDLGCLNGSSGNVSVSNGKTSFTVKNFRASLTGTMDVVISPPSASSPSISALEITYDSIEDIECTQNGKPVDTCVDAITYLNTAEFKQAMASAIQRALDHMNEYFGPMLEDSRLSFEQLAAEHGEPQAQA